MAHGVGMLAVLLACSTVQFKKHCAHKMWCTVSAYMDTADSASRNNEKLLTYERELFGGSGLQVHAVLQPEEFGIWDAVGVAVEAGRYTGLLGLRLWIDQDHWRDWTHKQGERRT